MFMSWIIHSAVTFVCIGIAASFPYFRDRIPNGHQVPNPCDTSKIWNGVGHEATGGGGIRNAFGSDFAANGFRWSEALCKKDSDGDGKSNGEELGDPDCVWSSGRSAARSLPISHPGICDPVDSVACKNRWNPCRMKNKENAMEEKSLIKSSACAAFSEPGVETRDVRLIKMNVPEKHTTYICQLVELEVLEKKVHFVASKPIIDNPGVVHHMILYGCPVHFKANDSMLKPFECPMLNFGCYEIWDVWAGDLKETCFNSKEGILLDGTKGRKIFGVLQIQWSNPLRVSGIKDASGFEIYITEKLRPYNAGIAMYGQTRLILPSGKESVHMQHSCPAECSKTYMKEPKQITMAMIHMHTYGVRGRVSLWRNNTLVKDIVPLHAYDYNTPVVYSLNPPVLFYPGDVVKTDCFYNTQGANETIYYGNSTQDEMCYGIFRYFPNDVTQSAYDKIDTCTAWGELENCKLNYKKFPFLLHGYTLRECNIEDVIQSRVAKQNISIINKVCGQTFGESCDPQCKRLVQELYKQEPCLDPKRGRMYMNHIIFSEDMYISRNVVLEYNSFFLKISKCEKKIKTSEPNISDVNVSNESLFEKAEGSVTSRKKLSEALVKSIASQLNNNSTELSDEVLMKLIRTFIEANNGTRKSNVSVSDADLGNNAKYRMSSKLDKTKSKVKQQQPQDNDKHRMQKYYRKKHEKDKVTSGEVVDTKRENAQRQLKNHKRLEKNEKPGDDKLTSQQSDGEANTKDKSDRQKRRKQKIGRVHTSNSEIMGHKRFDNDRHKRQHRIRPWHGLSGKKENADRSDEYREGYGNLYKKVNTERPIERKEVVDRRTARPSEEYDNSRDKKRKLKYRLEDRNDERKHQREEDDDVDYYDKSAQYWKKGRADNKEWDYPADNFNDFHKKRFQNPYDRHLRRRHKKNRHGEEICVH